MSHFDATESILYNEWLADKIVLAFFATLLDEDIEQKTSNRAYEGFAETCCLLPFFILRRLLGLPHHTSLKEIAFLEEEFFHRKMPLLLADRNEQEHFKWDYPFIGSVVNYVFLGGVLIEPLKALWQVAFEFPLRVLEVSLQHIRQYLDSDGIVNKAIYPVEIMISLPRLLSRAILRPMRNYYLVSTAFEDSPKLKRAAQLMSAVISITAAVAVCVTLPLFIRDVVPIVAPLLAHIATQVGEAVTFLGTPLGTTLTISVTVAQATFNSLLPMSVMLFSKKCSSCMSNYSKNDAINAETSSMASSLSSSNAS